ncbi:hypothetical protein Cch01nite_24270 [Cellulomonas chitinilytica]|uniref:Uncharacterized protein n=1 Tax=Cellulomonas chitinilytica TaxID=398759 RepID=A0A919P4D2_9CELL|nr:hypothetical protein [Cellulomonas chitinilytica]GIG21703.1 hypothetical protein Cch01nite_24270 [Cellulomonas chitinilytica]
MSVPVPAAPASQSSGSPAPGSPSPAGPSPARPPSVHRRALLTWVAVYPTITVALLLLRPLIHGLPVVLQTLVLTAVVVPPVVYVVIPALARLDARLARRRSR